MILKKHNLFLMILATLSIVLISILTIDYIFYLKEPYQKSPEKYEIMSEKSNININFSKNIFKPTSINNSILYNGKYGTIKIDKLYKDTDDYILFLKFSGKTLQPNYLFLSPYSYDSKKDMVIYNCKLKISFSIGKKNYKYERPWSSTQVTSSNSVSIGFNLFQNDNIWEKVKNLNSLKIHFELLNLQKQTWRKKL